MNFYVIIPARYQSTRFPGKPLVNIKGKPMIQRVYEQSLKAPSIKQSFVATDDSRIVNTVESFGGNAILTSEAHTSGTERCCEAVKKIGLAINSETVIINVQGDEPYINPKQIETVCKAFLKTSTEIVTLVKKIDSNDDIFNPNVVKCVFSKNKKAIYFSRNPIPFNRNQPKEKWATCSTYYKHIGIYAYKTNVLEKITTLPPSVLEQCESLEQLRWIENDLKISIEETVFESFSIDVPDDIQKIK